MVPIFCQVAVFLVRFRMATSSLVVSKALSEERIASFIKGEQSLRKGKSLVAGSFVRKLELKREEEGRHVFGAVVQAEMRVLQAYIVEAALSETGIFDAKCVCDACTYQHVKCKHIAALLYAILIVFSPNYPEPSWIANRKNKVRRYASPGSAIWKAIRGDLSFEKIKEEAVSEVEKHNGKSIHVLCEPNPKKGRKRPTYCICQGENNGELMIQCDDCKRWYHLECLERIGKSPEKEKQFICKLFVGCKNNGKEEKGKEKDHQKKERTERKKQKKMKAKRKEKEEIRKRKSESKQEEKTPQKRRMITVEYPPEIENASELVKENWRLSKIYEQYSTKK